VELIPLLQYQQSRECPLRASPQLLNSTKGISYYGAKVATKATEPVIVPVTPGSGQT